MVVKELELLENTNLRSEMLHKIEVLDKVGRLLLLPNTEIATTKMVAEYFEVSQDVIRDTIRRNKEELESNGLIFKSYKETKILLGSDSVDLGSESISRLGINKRGVNIFSKRAILNVAMLLRDSLIAKEVRTALLDQQDVITDEQKVVGITESQKLLLAVMEAPDEVSRLIAMNELNNYNNRHIAELNVKINEMKPKSDYYDYILKSLGTIKTTVIAKDYGYTAISFNKLLHDFKIQYRQGNVWFLYSNYQDKNYMKSTTTVKNGSQRVNNEWTQEGRMFLYEYLKSKGIIPLIEKSNMLN